jgi:hypothetical protein
MSEFKSKKITQETFDEVVTENIEEFKLDREEAILDAVKQFTTQGVDLSDIDLSGDLIGKQEVIDAIALIVLNNVSPAKVTEESSAQITQSLNVLIELCSEKHEMSRRNLILMRTNEGSGLNALHALLFPTQIAMILVKSLALLETVSATSVENRDYFEPNGSQKLCEIIAHQMDNIELDSDLSIKVITTGLSLAKCVAKSENNKGMLMRYGMGEIIIKLLHTDRPQNLEGWSDVKKVACYVLRGLSVHDDYRKEMSCAHDNGRFFLGSTNTVPALMKLSQDFRERPSLASAALSAARNLITTEEAVLVMCQHGGMKLSKEILSLPDAPPSLVRAIIGFIRNLCADDSRKENLVCDGSMALMVAALSESRFSEDSGLIEHGAACLAAMTLRSPSNSEKIVECGAIEVLVKCMRNHVDKPALQRQGCLAIRNIAARCPHLRSILLDAGVESVLRKAGTSRDAVDEAYAALRDLQCEVQFVKITENGHVEEAYEQFGQKEGEPSQMGSKMRFNPVYDEVEDIHERVQNEAKAPFEAENLRPFASNGTADK